MQNDQALPVEIPQNILSASALSGVIVNFIEREGTDYGAIEVSLSTKIEQIKKQLHSGDIKIIFDPNTETVTLVPTSLVSF